MRKGVKKVEQNLVHQNFGYTFPKGVLATPFPTLWLHLS